MTYIIQNRIIRICENEKDISKHNFYRYSDNISTWYDGSAEYNHLKPLTLEQ